jgi:CheY-like chemotaxis protein
MSGIQLMHRIKESQPHLPVVLVSAFELSHYEKIIADHFANGVLAKPLTLQTLQSLFDNFGVHGK